MTDKERYTITCKILSIYACALESKEATGEYMLNHLLDVKEMDCKEQERLITSFSNAIQKQDIVYMSKFKTARKNAFNYTGVINDYIAAGGSVELYRKKHKTIYPTAYKRIRNAIMDLQNYLFDASQNSKELEECYEKILSC